MSSVDPLLDRLDWLEGYMSENIAWIPSNNEPKCENCQFSRGQECRRKPPVIVEVNRGQWWIIADDVSAPKSLPRSERYELKSLWPEELPTDWCGEYQSAAERLGI